MLIFFTQDSAHNGSCASFLFYRPSRYPDGTNFEHIVLRRVYCRTKMFVLASVPNLHLDKEYIVEDWERW